MQKGGVAELQALIAHARQALDEARRECDAHIQEAIRVRAQGADAFWSLGRMLCALAMPRMRAGLGRGELGRIVRERVGVPRTTAWKLMAVASDLPQATAESLGFERAYAVVLYARTTGQDAAALVKSDAAIDGRPLSRLSVRALHAAVAAAKARHPKRAQRAVERKESLRALTAALRPLGIRADAVAITARGVRIALDWDAVARVGRRGAR